MSKTAGVRTHMSENVVAKALMEAKSSKERALDTLHHYFQTRRDGVNFPWHATEEEKLVRLHAQFCVELQDADKVHEALQLTFVRLKAQAATFRLVGLVDFYIGEAEEALNRARNASLHLADESSKPSSPTTTEKRDNRVALAAAVKAMTGRDVEQTHHAHSEEIAYRLYVDVVIACLRITQKCNNLGVASLQRISRALLEIAKGRRVIPAIALCRKIKDFTEPVKNREKTFPERAGPGNAKHEDERPKIWRDRGEEFLGDSAAMTQVISTLRVQLTVASEVGAWMEVLGAVNEFRVLLNIFKEVKLMPHEREILAFNSELKRVLMVSKRYPFVAHLAIAIARVVCSLSAAGRTIENYSPSVAATEAVLAVLSVADARASVLAVAHDHEREKQQNLAASLELAAPPTRGTLIADLLKPGTQGQSLLDMASETARDLFQVLTADQSIMVCKRAAPLLDQLEAKYDMYLAPIRQCTVRALLPVVAKCFSSLSVARFAEMAAFYAESSFRNTLEPIIVDVASDPNSNVSLQIDEADNCVRFRAVASLGDRSVGVQSEFCQRLAGAVAPCFPSASAVPAAPFNFAEFQRRMEAETHHIHHRYDLCAKREEKRFERAENAKADIARRKNEDLERLVKKAVEQNEKRKQERIRKLKDEVNREVMIERRRWVIKQLRDRHKGIVFPDTVATDGDFLETVVRIVREFNAKVEGAKDSDAKRMDYWERACREEEAPKREQFEKDLALSNAQQADERRANRERAHRDEWERASKMKRDLAKFEPHRKKYENDITSLLQRGSVRDVQNDALAREMLERQRIAEEMAARGQRN